MNNIRRGHVTYYVNCIQLCAVLANRQLSIAVTLNREDRSAMAEEEKKAGFWATLPGILTGVAAVMTAVGGLILGLYQNGVLGSKRAVTTDSAASPSCPNHPSSQNTLPRAPRNPPPGNRIHTSQPWSSLRRTALSPRYSPIVLSIGNILGNSSFRMANTFLSTTSRCSKSCGSTTTMQKLRLPC